MAAFRIISNLRNLASNNRSQCLKFANICSQQHYFSSKVDKQPESSDPEKKKKTVRIPKITLVSPDESIQIVTLEEAQKISRRRDLKLIKVIDLDTKTHRPVFKLMSGSDYHAEDLKQREIRKEKKNDIAVKGEKLLLINSRITEHDLESRIKNIIRWLNKKYEIRVVLSGDSSNMETCVCRIFNTVLCILIFIYFILGKCL